MDAELQEKSQADLSRLAEMLTSECERAMEEYNNKLKEDPSLESKYLKSIYVVKRLHLESIPHASYPFFEKVFDKFLCGDEARFRISTTRLSHGRI